ncbi:HEAT repeat domain-containing protein [Haliangium sp.]|uniref:HEAT repeat domain-containing protein n=1 Tax=Haliangium sp. TaxID=2663208 RepID=UPI003D1108AE
MRIDWGIGIAVTVGLLCAISALGSVGQGDGDRVGPALEPLLLDSESLNRSEAAEILGVLRYRPARAALERVLGYDEDALPRASAAEALGDLGDPRALPTLEAGLLDEDGPVRSYVADSIGRLGDPAGLRAVRRQLERETWPRARGALIGAALRLGDSSAFERLLALIDDGDEETKIQAYNDVNDLLVRHTPRSLLERADELDEHLRVGPAARLREQVRRRLAELCASVTE